MKKSHRLKSVAMLILAVSAVGLLALVRTALLSGGLAGIETLPGCDDDQLAAAMPTASCTPVKATTSRPHEVVTDVSPKNTRDKIRDARDGQANRHHATSDAKPSSRDPRPGHTLAELCSQSAVDSAYHCRAGSYDSEFVAAGSDDKSAGTSGFEISGRVLTTAGRGLGGVKLVASPDRLGAGNGHAPGALRFWTMTDSLGVYAFDGLPDGEYTIRSSNHGPYPSTRITARAGVTYADLIVAQNTETVVEGQVLDSDGMPLEGVIVLPLLLGQPSTLTNNDGRFRLAVTVKPTVDAFSLRLQRPGYHEQSGQVRLERPGAPSATVSDMVMHPVESWAALSGTVYSDSGDALAGRALELRPRLARETYTTTTDRDGKFTFPMVESPAEYRLIVFGGADHKDHQQTVRMTVDTDELDVVIGSYEFGEVTGQVVNPNGVPVPNFDLVLRNTDSRKPNAVVRTDRFGNFEIPSAPAGELVLASQSTPSILVQGLRLKPGRKLHLPLVLDWGEHEIRGLIVDPHGNPVPASRIVLQWSHNADGVTTRATRRTAADTQGHFAFSNLGPGPHSLQIVAPGFHTVDINHDLSRQGYNLTVRMN